MSQRCKWSELIPFSFALSMPKSIATPRPPGRDASPSQGYPLAVGRQHTLIHLGEERQNGVKFLV